MPATVRPCNASLTVTVNVIGPGGKINAFAETLLLKYL